MPSLLLNSSAFPGLHGMRERERKRERERERNTSLLSRRRDEREREKEKNQQRSYGWALCSVLSAQIALFPLASSLSSPLLSAALPVAHSTPVHSDTLTVRVVVVDVDSRALLLLLLLVLVVSPFL
jgi:hypothetical protein